jgi:tripartite-type tricarboxylate transporter receptor subunit TctC
VQVLFEPLPASIEHIRSGKLHALAVTSADRSQTLPDVPAVSEFVAGYEASGWNGLCAPKNTPAHVVDRLNGAVRASLADPKMAARLADLGAAPIAGSSVEFGRLIASETDKWAKVIRAAGVKAG